MKDEPNMAQLGSLLLWDWRWAGLWSPESKVVICTYLFGTKWASWLLIDGTKNKLDNKTKIYILLTKFKKLPYDLFILFFKKKSKSVLIIFGF